MLLALWNLWRFSWPNTWLSGEYLMCTLRMLILLLDLWKVLYMGFPCGSAGKESACSSGDLGLIPRLGRSPGEGKGYPLQYSGLENSTIQSMGSQRVGHDWATFTFIHVRVVTVFWVLFIFIHFFFFCLFCQLLRGECWSLASVDFFILL